jgi:hypothetical protein
MGFRVDQEAEAGGIDEVEHAESACDFGARPGVRTPAVCERTR